MKNNTNKGFRPRGVVLPRSVSLATVPSAPASAAAPGVKVKEPSPSVIWADELVASGEWAVYSSHTTSASVIHRWADYYWAEVGSGEGVALAATWLHKNKPDRATSNTAKDCWDYGAMRLRIEQPLPDNVDGKIIIPLVNSYLHIDGNGNIVAKAPNKQCGLTWGLNLKSVIKEGNYIPSPVPEGSLFNQYLQKCLPDPEVRNLVQEQCAITLLPANYGVASWWTGAGRNGKSVMLDLMARFHKHTARLRLEDLGKEFGLEPMVGAGLVVVDEVDQVPWAEGRFKSLIAGNGVSVNRKNEKQLREYKSRAKWLIASNSMPFVKDKSNAVWARICLVDWGVTIAEQDRIPDLDRLIFEKEGLIVLDWLLTGALRVLNRGRFMTESERPNSVQALKQRIRSRTDSIEAWASAYGVVVDSKVKIPKETIYKSYLEFCEEDDHEPLEKPAFWRSLQNSGSFRNVAFCQHNIGGRLGVRCAGIRIGGEDPVVPTNNLPKIELISLKNLDDIFGS